MVVVRVCTLFITVALLRGNDEDRLRPLAKPGVVMRNAFMLRYFPGFCLKQIGSELALESVPQGQKAHLDKAFSKCRVKLGWPRGTDSKASSEPISFL